MTNPFEGGITLPEGWAFTRLSDGLITEVQTGFACGDHSRGGEGIPHLRPMNVSRAGVIDLRDVKLVHAVEVDRDERRLVRGDILFNNTNSPELVGKTAHYDDETPRAYSNHMTRIRCRPDAIDSKYCAFFLHHKWREGYFEAVCNNHVSQASISRSVLLETSILLPPLDEQKRIVARVQPLLARVQAARERVEAVPDILQRFREAVYSASCDGSLTETWEVPPGSESAAELVESIAAEHGLKVPVNDSDADIRGRSRVNIGFLAQPTLGGRPYVTSGSRGWAKLTSEHGPHFIRSENINRNVLDLTDAIRVNPPDGAEATRTLVQPGDLLLTITGNNVGRTAVVPEDCPAAHVSQHVAIIRLNSGLLTNYVWLWMQSPDHGQGQLRNCYYGETKPGLNLDQIKSVFIDVPSMEEQSEIIRRAGSLLTLADSIERWLASASGRVENMSQAILDKAFRGELVPTEAEIARQQVRAYESAEELLDRVRRTPVKPSTKGARPRGRRVAMTKSDKQSVKAAIAAMPTSTFSFGDLRNALPGDYEGLKDIVFSLLEDAEAGVEQLFEPRAKSIHFRRISP